MPDARGVTEVNGIAEYRYFAGGEWRTAESNKLFDVYRSCARALYARVAAGGRAEAKLAAASANTRSEPQYIRHQAQPPREST
jgi:hypothetical protein